MSISMKRYNDTIITPKDDRILFDQIFDDYGLIYGGSATRAASNKIHVGAARGFIKGTEVIIEAEDIAVNLSDSGTKNGRLKIVMDLADTETPIKFESEVAASFPALEQDANINYDNGRYEVVFATYKTTETTISSVTLVMPTMQSVKAKIQGINQSLNNLNDSKKTYLRLVLPNLAADAKTVCDYINKNYLMGQITPMYSIEFDAVVANADWFSGVLSTDSNVDSNARTVWGIVQRRSISADNSTLYKYFGSGAGGAGTVSPFKSYDQGYAQGVTDADNRANANSTNYKTGYNNGYNAGKSDGALTGVSGCCIAGWRSIDAYSNNQWVSGWTGVNPNYFTVNGYGIVPKRNFTATVYWQGYNKRDIDFYSNGVMGHRDNGTSMNGVKMNFYAGTQCGFKTNDSGGGSLGAGFIVLN
jgi:hypothetical protein